MIFKMHLDISVVEKLMTFIETVESSQTILKDDSCGFPIENLIYTQLFSVL